MPFEKYNAVITRLNAIREGINKANDEINAINAGREGDIPQRIKNIEDQLEKIDEYLLKVKAFQDLAKRNITSLNVQTIDAPPDYRVSLKRLRDWSLMITPNSNDDPYAQRVYVVAKCDEFFLEKKKMAEEKKTAAITDGTLFCSGMIAGEGLVGILLAFLAIIPFFADIADFIVLLFQKA